MVSLMPPMTGQDAEAVQQDPKFLAWLNCLHPEYTVDSIEVQAATFVNDKLLFATLKCEVHDSHGPVQGGIVFLRGGAAAVLVVLEDEFGDEWTVLTSQSRFPAGQVRFCEIPAGMLDETDGCFKGAAARELKEETGLEIDKADRFFNLCSVYPSPGGCDELIGIYVAEFNLTRAEIARLSRLVETTEGERIVLKIIPLDSLPEMAHSDAKSLLAYYRYLAQNCY